jgi:hypothetical protein
MCGDLLNRVYGADQALYSTQRGSRRRGRSFGTFARSWPLWLYLCASVLLQFGCRRDVHGIVGCWLESGRLQHWRFGQGTIRSGGSPGRPDSFAFSDVGSSSAHRLHRRSFYLLRLQGSRISAFCWINEGSAPFSGRVSTETEAFPQPFGLRNCRSVAILRKSQKSAKSKAIRDLHCRVACATLEKLQM